MNKTAIFKIIPTFPKYEINELGIVRHAEKKTPVFPDGNGITIKLYNVKMERQNMSIKGLIKTAFEVEYANKVTPKDYKEATQMYRDKKITLDQLSKFKPENEKTKKKPEKLTFADRMEVAKKYREQEPIKKILSGTGSYPDKVRSLVALAKEDSNLRDPKIVCLIFDLRNPAATKKIIDSIK